MAVICGPGGSLFRQRDARDGAVSVTTGEQFERTFADGYVRQDGRGPVSVWP
jgi:hypothetical protein